VYSTDKSLNLKRKTNPVIVMKEILEEEDVELEKTRK